MSKEIDKLKNNFKNLNTLKYLITDSINDLPKLIIEQYSIFFKQAYSNDLLSIINLHRKKFGVKELPKEVFTPSIDAKFFHIERELKKMHDKVSAQVFKYKHIQKAKRSGFEAIIIFMVAYFEDFLKETFKKQINAAPAKSLNFIEKHIKISDLKDFGFDLSKKMGEIVANKINFQDLNEVYNTYKKAFAIDIFNKKTNLKKKAIKLFQTRHLIVHNNSVIDSNYIKIVKCKQSQLRKKVNITIKDIKTHKSVLLNIADQIDKKLYK